MHDSFVLHVCHIRFVRVVVHLELEFLFVCFLLDEPAVFLEGHQVYVLELGEQCHVSLFVELVVDV